MKISWTLEKIISAMGYGLLLVLFVPLGYLMLFRIPRSRQERFLGQERLIASSLAEEITEPLLGQNQLNIHLIFERIRKNRSEIRDIIVRKPGKQLVLKTKDGTFFTPKLSESGTRSFFQISGEAVGIISVPILEGELGTLNLLVSREKILSETRRLLAILVLIYVVIFLLLYWGVHKVSLLVSDPLAKLDQVISDNIPMGPDFSQSPMASQEITRLISHFQKLSGKLQKMEAVFTHAEKDILFQNHSSSHNGFPGGTFNFGDIYGSPYFETEYLLDRYRWFVNFRWLAAAGILCTLILTRWIPGIQLDASRLILIDLFVVAYNIIFYLWFHARSFSLSITRGFLLAQVVLDILALTAILHFSGSIENPFSFFYVFHMGIASVLFSPSISYMLSGFTFFLYSGLLMAEFGGFIQHYPLFHTPAGGEMFLSRDAWTRTAMVAGYAIALGMSLVGTVYFVSSTERKRREAEMTREAIEKQSISRERFAVLGEISMGIAHDIRNPLHGILNCFEMLKNLGEETPGTKEIMDLMKEGLERINTIIQRLLEIGHPHHEEFRLSSINDICADTILLVEDSARRKNIQIHFIPDKARIRILVDGSRISEAVLNLLINAIDACGEADEITVRTGIEKSVMQLGFISISDSGEGIEKNKIKKIFNPFYTTKPIGKGSGLGLTLVRQVVEEHGGTMDIYSEAGKGTRITMFFPLTPDRNRVENSQGDKNHASSNSGY